MTRLKQGGPAPRTETEPRRFGATSPTRSHTVPTAASPRLGPVGRSGRRVGKTLPRETLGPLPGFHENPRPVHASAGAMTNAAMAGPGAVIEKCRPTDETAKGTHAYRQRGRVPRSLLSDLRAEGWQWQAHPMGYDDLPKLLDRWLRRLRDYA